VEALPGLIPAIPPKPLPEETRYYKSLREWERHFNLDRWASRAPRRAERPSAPWAPVDLKPAARFHRFVEAVLAFWRVFGGEPPAHLCRFGAKYAPLESTDRLWEL
jgi:hypothetical protein